MIDLFSSPTHNNFFFFLYFISFFQHFVYQSWAIFLDWTRWKSRCYGWTRGVIIPIYFSSHPAKLTLNPQIWDYIYQTRLTKCCIFWPVAKKETLNRRKKFNKGRNTSRNMLWPNLLKKAGIERYIINAMWYTITKIRINLIVTLCSLLKKTN